MKTKYILLVSLFSIILTQANSQIPAGYYSSLIGLTGDTLKDTLNNIIDGHTEYPYTSSSQDDCWDILKLADKDPDSSNNVLGIYSNFSMDGPKEYDSGRGWSREHVWAKSRGNFTTSKGVGTDLHNLRAEDVSTNTARNNRNFDDANTRYIDGSGNYSGTTDSYTSSTDWVWEPRDEVKGDIARTIFYMTVRYEGENGELDLELTDSLLSSSDQSPLHGKASTLYTWHINDTVSDAERARNDTIYKYQGNRNPFVDHPEYVKEIYGSKYGGISVGVNKIEKVEQDQFKIYPNPSREYITIESNGKMIQEIRIVNLQGKLISEAQYFSKTAKLDLSSLNRGVYFIQIIDNEGRVWNHYQVVH